MTKENVCTPPTIHEWDVECVCDIQRFCDVAVQVVTNPAQVDWENLQRMYASFHTSDESTLRALRAHETTCCRREGFPRALLSSLREELPASILLRLELCDCEASGAGVLCCLIHHVAAAFVKLGRQCGPIALPVRDVHRPLCYYECGATLDATELTRISHRLVDAYRIFNQAADWDEENDKRGGDKQATTSQNFLCASRPVSRQMQFLILCVRAWTSAILEYVEDYLAISGALLPGLSLTPTYPTHRWLTLNLDSVWQCIATRRGEERFVRLPTLRSLVLRLNEEEFSYRVECVWGCASECPDNERSFHGWLDRQATAISYLGLHRTIDVSDTNDDIRVQKAEGRISPSGSPTHKVVTEMSPKILSTPTGVMGTLETTNTTAIPRHTPLKGISVTEECLNRVRLMDPATSAQTAQSGILFVADTERTTTRRKDVLMGNPYGSPSRTMQKKPLDPSTAYSDTNKYFVRGSAYRRGSATGGASTRSVASDGPSEYHLKVEDVYASSKPEHSTSCCTLQ